MNNKQRDIEIENIWNVLGKITKKYPLFEEEPKKDKRWKPESDSKYYYADTEFNTVDSNTWVNDEVDNNRYRFGKCFQTKELAQAHLDRINAIATVTDYIYENEMLWTEGKQVGKYYLVYDKRRDELSTNWVGNHTHLMIEIPFLKSTEACEQLIKVLPEELKLIFK